MKFTVSGRTEAGGEAAVTIDVQRRAYPDAPQADDANWVSARIAVVLPGYQASFDGRLRAEDFPPFLHALKCTHEAQHGVAAFFTAEEIIELRGELDSTGDVQWSGMTTYPADSGAVLSFAFTSGRAQLPNVIAGLEAVCKQFPVIG